MTNEEPQDSVQRTIDAGRTKMAQEIVDGQADGRPEMTVEDWKRFAHSWITTAAQHAANETYYREQRDHAVKVLEQVTKLGTVCADYGTCTHGACDDSALATILALNALKELFSEGGPDPMKILPVMSKGVVFVHEDGKTFELAPLQVFLGGSGQTVIRIGRNVLFFDKSGRFDGTESHPVGIEPDSEEAKRIREAFEVQGQNRGLPPDEPYFLPGTPPHASETRAWPAGKQEDDGKLYTTVHGKPPVATH